jgi:hypothetical protein
LVSVSSCISAPISWSIVHAVNWLSFPSVGVPWSCRNCIVKSWIASMAFVSASMRTAWAWTCAAVASCPAAAACMSVSSGTERHRNSESLAATS